MRMERNVDVERTGFNEHKDSQNKKKIIEISNKERT